jgi:outer membrane protein assembly factor BamC
MKFVKVTALVLMPVLSGCSWLYGEQGLIHDSTNDYLKSKEENPLQLPQGYDSSRLKDELAIPPIADKAKQSPIGPELDAQPPIQILAVTQGMRVDRSSEIPAIFWMIDADKLHERITAYLEFKDVSYRQESNRYLTDWIVTDNEAWWRSVFGTDLPRFVREKFDLSITPSGVNGEYRVAVKLLDRELMPYDEDQWIKAVSDTRSATEFLNGLVGYIDYLERVDNAKRLQELNRGITMSLGKDKEGNAALVATDSDWRTLWLKTPKVLEPFGFKLTDKDQTTGTYFFEFEANEPGFFASLFGDEEGIALELPNGAYQVIVSGKEGGAATLTLLDTEGLPLSDAKMAQLFPYLSEAFGKNMRDKRKRRK